MLNNVTIITGDNVRVGSAQVMHNELGEEILVVKTERRRNLYPATKKAAEEIQLKETRIVKAPENASKAPRLSVKSKGGRRGTPVVCIDNNLKFDSIAEAAKTLFPDRDYAAGRISSCCRGIVKTAYGLSFKYID